MIHAWRWRGRGAAAKGKSLLGVTDAANVPQGLGRGDDAGEAVNRPVCPICGDDSTIAKVSGIVRGATSRGFGNQDGHVYNYQGGSAQYSGTSSVFSQSDLARALARPLTKDMSSFRHTINLGYGLTVLGAFLCLLGLGGLGHGTWMFGFVPGGLLIWGGLLLVNNNRRAVKSGAAAQEVRKGERARAHWDAAYYCYRHDIVFVPGNTTYAPAGEASEFWKR